MKKQFKMIVAALILLSSPAFAKSAAASNMDEQSLNLAGKIAAVQEDEASVVQHQILQLMQMQDQANRAVDDGVELAGDIANDIGKVVGSAQMQMEEMRRTDNLDNISALKAQLDQYIRQVQTEFQNRGI